ncbi:hypothetical protein AC249_AIPGENE15142 [Exaiptasia diaphana]|nr:hypothetical protein AC249_AIPGENE15142 [Exaiptasia diaphana]
MVSSPVSADPVQPPQAEGAVQDAQLVQQPAALPPLPAQDDIVHNEQPIPAAPAVGEAVAEEPQVQLTNAQGPPCKRQKLDFVLLASSQFSEPEVKWCDLDLKPIESLGPGPQPETVASTVTFASPSEAILRDPWYYVPGELHRHAGKWKSIPGAPSDTLKYLTDKVNAWEFIVPFQGTFIGQAYDSPFPPKRVFQNNRSCVGFESFITDTILERVGNGSLKFWGLVDDVEPPYLGNIADLPSRVLSPADAVLARSILIRLESGWGPHSIDLMALDSNAQRDLRGVPLRHFSPWPTESSEGVNVFAQTISPGENTYVFPPLALVGPLLRFQSVHGVRKVTFVALYVQPRRYWHTGNRNLSYNVNLSRSFVPSPKAVGAVVPLDILRFLVWKDRKGKTQVHGESCPFIGNSSKNPC